MFDRLLGRKASSFYPLQKNAHLFAAVLRPFVSEARILTREIVVRPTCACKIFIRIGKGLPELFAKSRFWANTHITPSCIMTFIHHEGSNVIGQDAWQRTGTILPMCCQLSSAYNICMTAYNYCRAVTTVRMSNADDNGLIYPTTLSLGYVQKRCEV